MRERVEQINNRQERALLDGYGAMAAEREREAKAEEWCEGLICDAANPER